MKGITKGHKSMTKDYESLFYSMKYQHKKFFALHLRSYIPIPIAAFKLLCKISHI